MPCPSCPLCSRAPKTRHFTSYKQATDHELRTSHFTYACGRIGEELCSPPACVRKSGDGLAMSVAEYASYDAVGLAELVRKREVSPTELVEAAIERIEKHRMRQPFPKLRLRLILKASCSSFRPARARPAVRRRGPPLRPLRLRPRPLRLHQDLGAASCCP